MRLELLLSETTPLEVAAHLQEAVAQSPLPFSDISSARYALPSKIRIAYEEFDEMARAKALANSVLNKEGQVLDIPGIDIVTTAWPPKRRRHNYYHLGHLFKEGSQSDNWRLIALPHRFVLVASYIENMSPFPLLNETWNDGSWLDQHRTGVISLSLRPTIGNAIVALHELGHGFGLEHHQGCIMSTGSNYNHKVKNNWTSFCGDCLDRLALVQ